MVCRIGWQGQEKWRKKKHTPGTDIIDYSVFGCWIQLFLTAFLFYKKLIYIII